MSRTLWTLSFFLSLFLIQIQRNHLCKHYRDTRDMADLNIRKLETVPWCGKCWLAWGARRNKCFIARCLEKFLNHIERWWDAYNRTRLPILMRLVKIYILSILIHLTGKMRDVFSVLIWLYWLYTGSFKNYCNLNILIPGFSSENNLWRLPLMSVTQSLGHFIFILNDEITS